MKAPENDLSAEIDRLYDRGLADAGYTEAEIERCAAKTLEIENLKRETGAVVPAHVYQRPEILLGIADFQGDSYKLAKDCVSVDQGTIVFCGVRFMAETAKILNPGKRVILPAAEAGCSLADSISGEDVRSLKAEHPGVPVVSYINTNVDVKAESDVIVTSANAPKILTELYKKHERILFLPDAWMGRNLARQLGKTVGEEMIVWDGKCIVHEEFDPRTVEYYRGLYPGVKVLAHSECSPALIDVVDRMGGTGDMMRYVEKTEASAFMLVTECGLGELARAKFPKKRFVSMCRLCPHMKAIDLDRVRAALAEPEKACVIEVDPDRAKRAKRAIERMFEIAEGVAQA